MDLNHLAVFVAVAEAKGISAAAKKLGLPKSSVSRALAALESELGVQLMHRTTRQVSLTSAGSSLFERASPQLRALASTVAEISDDEDAPSGMLRVTAPVDFGVVVLAELIAKFTARYPAVSVDVTLTNALVDLVAERFDLAVRLSGRRLKDSSLIARQICPLQMQLFASVQYLGRRGTPRTIDDLEGHSWATLRGLEKLELTSSEDTVVVSPKGAIKCDDMFFLREITVAGGGIALLPTFLAEPRVATGELVRVLPRYVVASGAVWLVHPSARNVPAKVVAFREFVTEQLRARFT